MDFLQLCKYIFFGALGILFYTYIGYGVVAYVVGMFRRRFRLKEEEVLQTSVTVIIPAYNESGVLKQKVNNTIEALKPFNYFQIIINSEGSNDGSEKITFNHPNVIHLRGGIRKGKSYSINQSVMHATGSIIVITDANAMINQDAILKLVSRFSGDQVGAVSGEKKVMMNDGSTGGEGLYWKYESFLKRSSASMYSLTGAAGELLAFRKELFKPLPEDAILDDMELSLNIIRQNKIIDYEPEAYAIEPPSGSIKEEFKRKVRISAGVFQTLNRNLFLFNPFKHFLFWFQFNSHRVMRWFMGLLCILLIAGTSLAIVTYPLPQNEQYFFVAIILMQFVFYAMVILGFLFRNVKGIPAFVFLPFYFLMMNVAVPVGFLRYITGRESVLWQKISR